MYAVTVAGRVVGTFKYLSDAFKWGRENLAGIGARIESVDMSARVAHSMRAKSERKRAPRFDIDIGVY